MANDRYKNKKKWKWKLRLAWTQQCPTSTADSHGYGHNENRWIIIVRLYVLIFILARPKYFTESKRMAKTQQLYRAKPAKGEKETKPSLDHILNSAVSPPNSSSLDRVCSDLKLRAISISIASTTLRISSNRTMLKLELSSSSDSLSLLLPSAAPCATPLASAALQSASSSSSLVRS